MRLKKEWISVIPKKENYQLINSMSGQKSEINLDTLTIIQNLPETISIEKITREYPDLSLESTQLLLDFLTEMNLVFEENITVRLRKLPLIEEVTEKLFDGNNKKSKIAVLGLPYDGATSGKTGTKVAPDFLRKYTAGISSNYLDVNLESRADHYYYEFRNSINDVGNVLTVPGEGSQNFHRRVFNSLSKLIDEGEYGKFIFLGGDHSVSYPLLQSLSSSGVADIIYIKFDAHYDSSGEIEGLPVNHHNYISKIRKLSGVSDIFHIGAREPRRSTYDISEDLVLNCLEDFNENIIKTLKGKKVYISIDIDILDPLVNPGTGFQVPFGISLEDLISKLEQLQEFDVIAIDIVEYNPLLDRNQKSLYNVLKLLEKSITILERIEK
ncbi:arginase family protein [Alkalibacterium olivapovliticus]|uniref:Agmatinase n=1 Tax=Alkalibacterium olivapovliticus TaxID=99907 RepID=A0A2T0VT63_9LACT|nr:arginase family protein [Alkalibacterium olivapovliticus]PRY74222.1 agmatinase [Alkalibacterium olivapovliticus]